MSKTDPLQAFFAAGEAPAVDRAFRTRVMEAVARRRLRIEIAASALAGLVVYLVLLLLRPAFETLVPDLSAALQGAVVILAAIGLAIYAGNLLLTRPLRLPGWTTRFF
tara:strand:+ start:1010 stop:1333 length:324 start_codon:yes stop_codon:yes gene_type:complete